MNSIDVLSMVIRTHIEHQLSKYYIIDPILVQLIDDLNKAYAETEENWDSKRFWMACGL